MKVLHIKKETLLAYIYIIILAIGIISSTNRKNKEAVTTFSMPVSKKIVLIDAGHGGWDPGKVGKNEIYEKYINIEIATKLQQYLEQGDAYVLMTRIDDAALGESKSADMYARKNISDTSEADILVSIHQNSFPKKSVKGAQVFYFKESPNSQLLAECIQTELKDFLGQGYSKRTAAPNDNYYILRKTKMPAVIVECGFMSNPNEHYLLTQEEYQEKVAWGIYMGIVDYFEKLDNQPNQ